MRIILIFCYFLYVCICFSMYMCDRFTDIIQGDFSVVGTFVYVCRVIVKEISEWEINKHWKQTSNHKLYVDRFTNALKYVCSFYFHEHALFMSIDKRTMYLIE